MKAWYNLQVILFSRCLGGERWNNINSINTSSWWCLIVTISSTPLVHSFVCMTNLLTNHFLQLNAFKKTAVFYRIEVIQLMIIKCRKCHTTPWWQSRGVTLNLEHTTWKGSILAAFLITVTEWGVWQATEWWKACFRSQLEETQSVILGRCGNS